MPTVTLACSHESCDRAGDYSRGLCRRHYVAAARRGDLERYSRIRAVVDRGPKPTACAHCGEPFKSVAVRDTWTATCSKACAAKAAIRAGRSPLGTPHLTPDERSSREFARGENARRMRRARLAGVQRESYTTAEVAARDDHLCGLCGGRVDMALRFPNRMSASVDHILPLSLGGNDMLANVQLAHLGCNLRKGASF